MGLLDRLKSNKNNKDFFEWLDLLLKNELRISCHQNKTAWRPDFREDSQ